MAAAFERRSECMNGDLRAPTKRHAIAMRQFLAEKADFAAEPAQKSRRKRV
jgi:hypothetical protein